MFVWIKKNHRIILTAVLTVALAFWLYSCESQVKSLIEPDTLINRTELQLELDTFVSKAAMRMADLDRQDAFRSLIIENSLVLVQGLPLEPVGIITAIAGIYGLTHATSKVVRAAQKTQIKRRANNGK